MCAANIREEWETLVYDNDYEININYPYPIRKKGKSKVNAESLDGSTYYRTYIKANSRGKHKLIALQWLGPPPDSEHTIVDHINKNHLDNHLNNLRYVNAEENANNKTVHAIVPVLPQDAIRVIYKNNVVVNCYYSKLAHKFYMFTGTDYREYDILYDPQGYRDYVIVPKYGTVRKVFIDMTQYADA